MTFLSESSIPGAEEGLFCRQDVAKETLLSFYHGLNVPYDCDYTQELHAFDEVDKSCVCCKSINKNILGEEDSK